MNITKHSNSARLMGWLAGAGLAAMLTACGGGGYGGGGMPPPPSATTFSATKLVTDGTGGAPFTDTHLVNAWGLAFNPTGYAWVANNGSATSTLYDGNGAPQSLVVTTPDAPTGLVFNGTGQFMISKNGVTASSPFIFSTESGAIAAWSPSVSANATVTMFDGGAANNVYKGLAIASYLGANYLYATDFHNGRVDVFDAGFAKAALPGSFTDPGLPAGYAPFGIQAMGGSIYVSYAQKQAGGDDETHGPGAGVLDQFDTGGMFVKRLVTGGALNAPWGMAMAPSDFGTFSGKLLVANFGDGKINAFDPASGAALGALGMANGSALVIDGLWAIGFGNGHNSQPANTLFYTAGPNDEAHGAYGRIDMR